jgi:hexosaminidase
MSIFNEWFIECQSYTGLTRALETYSQLFFY